MNNQEPTSSDSGTSSSPKSHSEHVSDTPSPTPQANYLKRSIQRPLLSLRTFVEFCGKHPFATGLFALLSIIGLVVSIIGYQKDREEALTTTEQVDLAHQKLNEIVTKLDAPSRDWQVMESTFYGIRIGGSVKPAYNLGFERISRTGRGSVKRIVWRLDNENRFSVAYDSAQDRILRITLDWGGENIAREFGFSDFKFGETTPQNIPDTFESNGSSYARHIMSESINCPKSSK